MNLRCYVSLTDPCEQGPCVGSDNEIIVTGGGCCVASTVRWWRNPIDCCEYDSATALCFDLVGEIAIASLITLSSAGYNQVSNGEACCPNDKTYLEVRADRCFSMAVFNLV